MSLNIWFRKAEEIDSETLTDISVAAFNSDILVGGKEIGGPPGYDSTSFHCDSMNKATAFYCVCSGEKLIGAFWFYQTSSEQAYLARIFVDPQYQRLGIGAKCFDFLFDTFPDFKEWKLETPPWNIRTRKFYLKLGFEIFKETQEDVFFVKKRNAQKI